MAKTGDAEELSTARLRGRGLLIARIIWAMIVFIDLLILVPGIPALVIQLHTPCLDPTQATCNIAQLLPVQMATLHSFGISLDAYIIYTLICDILITLLLLLIGILIFWHKSDDRLGLFVSLLLITTGSLGTDLIHFNALGIFVVPLVPVSFIYQIFALFGDILAFLIWPALSIFFCIFPDGRFVPRWSWLLPGLFIVQFGFYILPPPWNFLNWPPFLQGIEYVLVYGSAAGTQIYRYFVVASPLQRQQIKWLALGFGLDVFVLLPLQVFLQAQSTHDVHAIVNLVNPLGEVLAYLPIPLSIGIALLRYRLWDIDTVISRTLVYGLLTLILVLVYLSLVFGGQSLLTGLLGSNNPVLIVISTLIVAALFQPLRGGLQRLIDRRFYRQKYDAARTLQAFSATLQREVNLEQLHERLLAVVQETMQPAHVSLWLLKPARDKHNTQAESVIEEGALSSLSSRPLLSKNA